MKRALCSALAAIVLPLAANAATIEVTSFDLSAYNSLVGAGSYIGADFEAEGAAQGEGEVAPTFSTAVGSFTSTGGTGSGGTVSGLAGNTGEELALRRGNVYGRTDQVGGTWFLDSNDTYGIEWSVSTGSMFNTVMFALTDHAEYSTMTIEAGGMTRTISGIGGSVSQLIAIDFGSLVSSAVITLDQATNDGFSIDGAQVGVAPVPLPAAGFLLIGGLGGLAMMRRFKGDKA